ncbi:hypothetical protein BD309DRAFT_948652 [Dichomitus squalens]|nr:hypothetical protein BD309DRAFT_948652 [Dichomitus squalens]
MSTTLWKGASAGKEFESMTGKRCPLPRRVILTAWTVFSLGKMRRCASLAPRRRSHLVPRTRAPSATTPTLS